MSRTIKFRAIARLDSRWRYGQAPLEAPHMENTTYPMNTFWSLLLTGLRRETLGQYTGLKDRTGREIYEGDVVFDHDTEYGGRKAVVWDQGRCCFELDHLCGHPLVYGSAERYLEIVGNIHEQAEAHARPEGETK